VGATGAEETRLPSASPVGSTLPATFLLLASWVIILQGALLVLFLPLLVDVLGVNAAWLGAVDLAQSASMILSASLVGILAARFRPTAIVTTGLVGLGILLALVGQSTSLVHVVGLLFLMGWLVTPAQAAIVTIMQTGVDDASRGRVMATLQASMSGAGIASMLFAGVFGELLGVRIVFLLAGGVVTAGGLLALVLYRGVAPETQPTLPDRPGTTVEGAPG